MGHVLLAIAVLLGFLIGAATVWVPHSAARLQNRLHEQVRAALNDAGYTFAAAAVDGRTLTLSGLAPDAGQRDAVQIFAAGLPGVREVHSAIELDEQFVLQASFHDSQLCLRGVVPSEALRLEWTALSPMPCMRDLDATLGVDPAPSGWIWPGAVLAELVRLERADLEASEHRVQVRGWARNAKQREVVGGAIRRMVPVGVVVDLELMLVPPAPAPAPGTNPEGGA